MATVNMNIAAPAANLAQNKSASPAAALTPVQPAQQSFAQILQAHRNAQTPQAPQPVQTAAAAPTTANPPEAPSQASASTASKTSTPVPGTPAKSAASADRSGQETNASANSKSVTTPPTPSSEEASNPQEATDPAAQATAVDNLFSLFSGKTITNVTKDEKDAALPSATDTQQTETDPTVLAAAAAAFATQSASPAGNCLPVSHNNQQQEGGQQDATAQGQQLTALLTDDTPARKPVIKPEDLIADSHAEKSPATSGQEKNHSFTQELNNATQNLNLNPASPGNASNGPQMTENLRQVDTPAHEIRTPVATQGWSDEVGQKLSWIANSTGGRAELILTPPHMGRVEVSINMNGDQASASFMAANQTTRDALQDAMPRLREVLAQSGIHLGQANVNTNANNQNQPEGFGRHSANYRFSGQEESPSLSIDTISGGTRSAWTRYGNGMVDTFA
jgi:flagellar hook-length control protein FliK